MSVDACTICRPAPTGCPHDRPTIRCSNCVAALHTMWNLIVAPYPFPKLHVIRDKTAKNSYIAISGQLFVVISGDTVSTEIILNSSQSSLGKHVRGKCPRPTTEHRHTTLTWCLLCWGRKYRWSVKNRNVPSICCCV